MDFYDFSFFQFSTLFMTYDIFPTLVEILLMTVFCFNIFRLIYRSKFLDQHSTFSILAIYFSSFISYFSKVLASKVSIGISFPPSHKTFFSTQLSLSLTSYYLSPRVVRSLFLEKITLFIGAILIIEVSQYAFSLGFFDLGDILPNTNGFVLGNFIGRSVIGRFFKNIVI